MAAAGAARGARKALRGVAALPPTGRRGRRRARRSTLVAGLLGSGAVGLAGGDAPPVLAEQVPATGVDVAQQTAKQLKRLAEDPEVQLLRKLQAGVRLFDTARGDFVGLTDALRPGQRLYDADLVVIGEQHDSEADHTMQRIILDSLTYSLLSDLRKTDLTTPQNLSPAHKVAVGVEYFYREQNDVLDALVYGGAPASVFYEQSQFQQVWNYDWALYKPLFRYVQLNRNRLVGLNIPFSKVREVSRNGIDQVDFRDTLPELDLSVPRHRRRFEDMMQLPVDQVLERMRSPPDFEPNPKLDRYYTSQCIWEEYMSETANRYLQANAGRMVVFAGFNHVWRDAIPDRFERQSAQGGRPLKAVSIVPWHWTDADPAQLPRFADYIVCMRGAGGGDEVAAAVTEQRARLKTQERVFPAGFV